jgi:hypothetical protein
VGSHAAVREPPVVKDLIVNVTWKVLLVAALAVCTALAWLLYDVVRNQRFDAVFGEWLHTARVTIQVIFRVDPVLMLVVFPLGILIVLILVGLLIWMQRAR